MIIKITATHKDEDVKIQEEYEFNLDIIENLKSAHQKEFLHEKLWQLRNNVTTELLRMQREKQK